MTWALLVSRYGLANAVLRVGIALLVIAALACAAWGFASGKVHAWLAEYWKERAVDAAARAETAAANARSAEAGAANATQTRRHMQGSVQDTRQTTQAAIERMHPHAHQQAPVADRHPVDPDILRELETGTDRVRTAADRLQRPRER